jgi:hypothetical protein
MTTEAFDKIKEKAIATLAGGCFWCMEPPFDAEPGALETYEAVYLIIAKLKLACCLSQSTK